MGFFSRWLRADDVYKEPSSGIEFPATMGGFKRGKTTSYQAEHDQTGLAIAYQAGDAEVTIYVRATGEEVRKTSADWLNESLAVVQALEAQGKYSNVKIYACKPEHERPGWKSARFTSSSTERFIVSFIYCKTTPGHLVKIRATTGGPKNDPLQSFLKSVQEIVDRASTK